jgi:acetyl esterase/lipase
MTQFYRKVLEYYPDNKIILMGDSAGGGLAAGLSMYFAKKGLPVPDKLILLSPWVDIEMENEEIKDYLEKDPILRYEDLKVDARYWANGHDLKDYRLSPLYGDVSVLKDVTLFTGTHEFFYPDIIRFGQKLEENGVRNRIFVGEKLYHVYPAFPIPEASDALRIIAQVIDDKL